MTVIFESFGLSKSFAHKELLKDANIKIEDRDRLGLIGPNGTGKTTLLAIIAGELEEDAGEIRKKEGLKVAWLKQHVNIPPEMVVSDALLTEGKAPEVENEIKAIEQKMQDPSFYTSDEYQQTSARYAELLAMQGGASCASKISEDHLLGLGFKSSQMTKKISELSGGDARKVMLAKALAEASSSDLLLLDEPSNHLDIDSCDYLENELSKLKCAYIIVSHDRYFLDRTVETIVELSHYRLKSYSGNYSEFAIKKEEQIRIQELQNAKDEKERARLESVIKEMQSRNRYDAKFKNVQRRLDKVGSKEIGNFPTDSSISLDVSASKKSGANVVNVIGLSKKFPGNVIFENAHIEIVNGDKTGLVGPNGSGKSTLLNMIAGLDKNYDGLIEVSYGTRLGYYSQHQEDLLPENTVLEELLSLKLQEGEAKHALARFLFRGSDTSKKVKTLSGGERARLSICKLVNGEHNFLILDEVTNHLDLESRHAVERALADYEGTILAASHDRYFLDSFTNKIASIKDKKLFHYYGNFSRYWQSEKRMRTLIAKGELQRFVVKKKYTDWTTGEKYTQGMVLELSELDLGGHRDAVRNGWLVPQKKR